MYGLMETQAELLCKLFRRALGTIQQFSQELFTNLHVNELSLCCIDEVMFVHVCNVSLFRGAFMLCSSDVIVWISSEFRLEVC